MVALQTGQLVENGGVQGWIRWAEEVHANRAKELVWSLVMEDVQGRIDDA
jgi:hypothetical protein